MYMDDDASIATPLDDIVQPNDKFIVGKEVRFRVSFNVVYRRWILEVFLKCPRQQYFIHCALLL